MFIKKTLCEGIREYISGENTLNVQPFTCMHFLCAFSRVFLTVFYFLFSTSLHARLPETSKALMKFITVM